LIQLKIEQVALKKEADAASKNALEILEEEIADLEKNILIWRKSGKRKKPHCKAQHRLKKAGTG